MPVTLYDSRSRRLVPLEPIVPGKVGIYVCGPTVYSEPHLGHARGPVVFDVLRRWLEHEGLEVRYVTNVTDVGHLTDDADAGEDKLAKRAKLERLEPMEVAEKYFWSYFDAMARLGVMRPSIVPRATGHIIEQIEMTQELVRRGVAYEAGGSVYFDVSAFEPYGELSGRDPQELLEGTRVEVRSDKRDPRDFALWKRAEEGHIMRWPSPWGEGFPGWHIECTVMSTKYLGDEFDIHGGGLDLIFPHHECELAQAKAAGKPFARIWMHWNMLTLRGEKMARSKGHLVGLGELFEVQDPMVVRFHLLRSHYRSLSDFAEEALEASAAGLRRLRTAYAAWLELGDPGDGDAARWTDARDAFAAAMREDLNTPEAIAVLFDVAREANKALDAGDAAAGRGARALFDELLDGVLGIRPTPGEGHASEAMAGLVDLVLAEREAARTRRDFARSDGLRDALTTLGITVEDTPSGTRWRRG